MQLPASVDVEMNTVGGYRISSWETGYGDFVMIPDLSTLPRCAVGAGLRLDAGGRPVAGRAAGDGVSAPDPPPPARPSRREGLGGVRRHRARVQPLRRDLVGLDQGLFGPDAGQSVQRRLLDPRHGPGGAGAPGHPPGHARRRNAGRSAKGECNFGQHEIAFKYSDALTTCDNHVVYKTAAKEIAAKHGKALTFMAKFNEREGNSCHVHLSLRTRSGEPIFAGEKPGGLSPLFERFVAGQLAGLRQLSLFSAPNINSYKRYQPGTFAAPTAVLWGFDNRTCALRVVGKGASLRFENRVPGGDVNPYLAVAAMIAAGLYGVDNELPLPEAFEGSGYDAVRGARSDVASRGRPSCGHRAPSREGHSATMSSTITPTWRVSSWRRSTAP